MTYLSSEIKTFEINEAGNDFVVPGSIQRAVVKRYEEKMSQLLKDKTWYRSNSDRQ